MPRNQAPLPPSADSAQGSGDMPPAADGTDRFDRLLVQIVDFGLAACIFVVPMLLGGRHALGRLAVVGIAVAVGLAWSLRQTLRSQAAWRRSSAEWLLLAGVVLLVVQVVPLPAALAGHLAPHASEILPLWSSDADSPARLGRWSQVSLTPAATRAALAVFLAYGLLFLVTVQRIRELGDVERLLRWCAVSAMVMGAFGIVQFLFSNGKFFWFYEHVQTDTHGVAKGAFTNRNHFAHFLALGVGPLIWWVQNGLRRPARRRPQEFGRSAGRSDAWRLAVSLRVVGLGVVLFAVLLSLSRGGALATLLAVAVSLAICYRGSSIGPKLAGSLGGVALLLAVSLAIFGHEAVSRRLGSLTPRLLEEADGGQGRRTIWTTVGKAIPDYPLLGAGVGSHRHVYPMYLEWVNSWKYFSHAECGYLQVPLESGGVGLALVLAGIAMCGFWCVTGMAGAAAGRRLVCVGAVAAGLVASAAHSLVDFVWYVPGCMVIVAILAACACRLSQLARQESTGRDRRVRLPRPVAPAMVTGLVVVGTWMIGNRAPAVPAEFHWDRFVGLNRESDSLVAFGFQQRDDSSDARYQAALDARQRVIAELEQVVRWDSEHALAHLELAQAYVCLFHLKQQTASNQFSVKMVRDAAIASGAESVPAESRLDSREKLEAWLSRAVGNHYRDLDRALVHTRRALSLCPLLGKGYLLLADLAFLEGGRDLAKSACVDQALTVRPFDGVVLLVAGSEAVIEGDLDAGIAYWNESSRRGPIYEEAVFDMLVGQLPFPNAQAEIDFLLRVFEPDLAGLRLLERRYRPIAPAEQMVALRRAYVAALEADVAEAERREQTELWLEAMVLHRRLDAPGQALECARKALRCDPNDLRVHEGLARCFVNLEQFAEAREHLDWCLRRKPGDPRLLELSDYMIRKEVAYEAASRRSRAASAAESERY